MTTHIGTEECELACADGNFVRSQVRTLADLARVAGVSAGTASRALSGNSLVNSDTRKRIRDLAQIYNFRPNQMASKLRSGRTGLLGLVASLPSAGQPSACDEFHSMVVGSIIDEVTAAGYDILLTRVVAADCSEALRRNFGSGMVDGVLLVVQSMDQKVLDQLLPASGAIVLWGDHLQGGSYPVVGTDNEWGGRIAAQTLIDAGATRLAFFGDATCPQTGRRHEGAAAAASAAGVGLQRVNVDYSRDLYSEIVTAISAASIPWDGVVAATDLIAMSALKAFQATGCKVPDEIRIVGFDDLPLGLQTSPSLTTVTHEPTTLARTMVDALLRSIKHENVNNIFLKPTVILRQTT